jgi:hypothetical protein
MAFHKERLTMCKDVYRGAEMKAKHNCNTDDAALPIDRPCSACSAGDHEMKYHLHCPPFRVTDTPIDSVERLKFEIAKRHNLTKFVPGDDGYGGEDEIPKNVAAALAEMWDLSQREALREAVAIVKSITPVPVAWCNDDHIRPTVAKIAAELERIVEEVTR